MIRTAKDLTEFVKFGFREVINLKQAFFYLFTISFIAIPLSVMPSGIFSQWCRVWVFVLVSACLFIHFSQTIIRKYRPITVTGHSIFLCIAFIIFNEIVAVSISDIIISLMVPESHFNFLIPDKNTLLQTDYYFTYIATSITHAILLALIWFYPFHILANDQNPLKNSLRNGKRYFISIIVICLAQWIPLNLLAHLLTHITSELLHSAPDRYTYYEYSYLYVLIRIELTAAMTIAGTAVGSAVYLSATMQQTVGSNARQP